MIKIIHWLKRISKKWIWIILKIKTIKKKKLIQRLLQILKKKLMIINLNLNQSTNYKQITIKIFSRVINRQIHINKIAHLIYCLKSRCLKTINLIKIFKAMSFRKQLLNLFKNKKLMVLKMITQVWIYYLKRMW